MKARRVILTGAVLALLAGLAIAFVPNDPVLQIRDELRAAARNPNNHAVYADFVREELAVQGRLKTATFTMPCFWGGEEHFGDLPGVWRTTPGRQSGQEAVRVDYDPKATSPDELFNAPVDPGLSGRGCRYDPKRAAFGREDPAFTPDTESDKWSIRQTDGLKCIPMTPGQAARVNALFHAGRPVEQLLSPTQNKLLERARRDPHGGWTEYVGDEGLWNLLRQSP